MKRIATYLTFLTSITLIGQDDLSLAQDMFENQDFEAVIQYVHSFEIRHADDLLLEADAYHKLKEYDLAIETYDQVLVREEDNVYALMRRGAAYLELGEFGFSVKDVRKALRIWPEHPEANFHMGNICYDQSDMKNAVKYYETALEHRPGYPQATYMLGAAKSEMGHYRDAEKAFDEVLNQFPDASYNLAVVKLENKKYDQALNLFNEAESKGISSADLYFFRAEAQFFLGDKHAACTDYKLAANLDDEEAAEIFDSYCLKGQKKDERKKREVIHIDL